jgi:hypothetical protein
VKAKRPGFFLSLAVTRLILPGLLAALLVPEPVSAQTKVEVSVGGFDFVYQGGRKSSRGLKRTTSSICLPDLNAILAPTPVNPKPKVVQAPVAKVKNPGPAPTPQTSKTPRFGYGSGPVQPPLADPRIPIDPGYDPESVRAPSTEKATKPQPVVTDHIRTEPLVQIEQTTVVPFAHSYYPRSYVPSVPFFYHHHHSYHHQGCGVYRSRSPLRGSLTSSRNYLSGIRLPGFSLRFSH